MLCALVDWIPRPPKYSKACLGKLSIRMASSQQSCVSKFLLRIIISHLDRFSTRLEVDNANVTRLRQLDVELHTYEAVERPGIDSNGKRVSIETMGRLLERLIVPKSIQLKVFPFATKLIFSDMLRDYKVGAQVMLVKVIPVY